MKIEFNLHYWVGRFNACQNDLDYTQVSQDYDNLLAQLAPEERQTAQNDFKAYTLRRLERLGKNIDLCGEIVEDYVLASKALANAE